MNQKNVKQTILRQNHEIENLKKKISELEISTNRKEDLTDSIDIIYTEWISVMNELDEKRNECDRLISDLKKIKSIMNINSVKIPWYKKLINRIK